MSESLLIAIIITIAIALAFFTIVSVAVNVIIPNAVASHNRKKVNNKNQELSKLWSARNQEWIEANRCYGVTLKGEQCKIIACSISHKSYLDK